MTVLGKSFSVNDFFINCEQIYRKLIICTFTTTKEILKRKKTYETLSMISQKLYSSFI